jgi:hypothetical protein
MPARERTRSNGRTRGLGVVPILEARPGGAAQRFAASMEGKHPAAVFFAAVLAGYVVLASLALLLGVFVTGVLVHTGGIGRADESAVESLVRERTGFLTDLSSVGSTLGGAPVLPILVGLIGIVCAIKGKWRIASFAVLVHLVDRGLLRSCAAAHLGVPGAPLARRRLDDRAAASGVRCGLAHVPRHAPPARCRRGRADRHRRGGGAAVRMPSRRRGRARARPGPGRRPASLTPPHPVVKLNKRDPQER